MTGYPLTATCKAAAPNHINLLSQHWHITVQYPWQTRMDAHAQSVCICAVTMRFWEGPQASCSSASRFRQSTASTRWSSPSHKTLRVRSVVQGLWLHGNDRCLVQAYGGPHWQHWWQRSTTARDSTWPAGLACSVSDQHSFSRQASDLHKRSCRVYHAICPQSLRASDAAHQASSQSADSTAPAPRVLLDLQLQIMTAATFSAP